MNEKIEEYKSNAPICKICGVKTYLTSFRYFKKRKKGKGDNRLIYMCPKCHNFVNVHKQTNQPLGFPGSKEVRLWRTYAHRIFDKLWEQKHMTRTKAYTWLSRKMKISSEECHIGMFDSSQCKLVIELCIKELSRKP